MGWQGEGIFDTDEAWDFLGSLEGAKDLAESIELITEALLDVLDPPYAPHPYQWWIALTAAEVVAQAAGQSRDLTPEEMERWLHARNPELAPEVIGLARVVVQVAFELAVVEAAIDNENYEIPPWKLEGANNITRLALGFERENRRRDHARIAERSQAWLREVQNLHDAFKRIMP
jgi:Domain of unknown function (DUF4259)